MSEATPGPWEWVKDTWHGGHAGLCGPDGAEVLWPTTANDGDHGAAWFDEQTTKDADLALIAAAPLLLAACEAAEKYVGLFSSTEAFNVVIQLAAAIKAAKGAG